MYSAMQKQLCLKSLATALEMGKEKMGVGFHTRIKVLLQLPYHTLLVHTHITPTGCNNATTTDSTF